MTWSIFEKSPKTQYIVWRCPLREVSCDQTFVEWTNLKSHHTALKGLKRLVHLVSNNSRRESFSVCWSPCFRVFTSSTIGLGAKRTVGEVRDATRTELAIVRSILRIPKPTRLDMSLGEDLVKRRSSKYVAFRLSHFRNRGIRSNLANRRPDQFNKNTRQHLVHFVGGNRSSTTHL